MDIMASPYKVIVGLDFGHGETVAYKQKLTKDAVWEGHRLRLNYEDTVTIPTYLSYSEEGVKIGHDAQGHEHVIQQFKLEPDQWTKKYDQEYSYGILMQNFIHEVWLQIRKYDAEIDALSETEELLLVVGCPASEIWTCEQNADRYRIMISRVTGCKHVEILPESVGAMLNYVEESANEIKSGLVVYDLGSSTIDFSYLEEGKPIIFRSLRVAGSDIDRAMLEKVLEENGYQWEDVPDEYRVKFLIQLRQKKEDFYRKLQITDEEMLVFYRKQEDGSSKKCRLFYTVNDEFMGEVLEKVSVQWKEFIQETHKLVKKPVQQKGTIKWSEFLFELLKPEPSKRKEELHVIITGGTSFVSGVKELIESEYGCEVHRDKDPSVSVAQGLCKLKMEEWHFREQLNNYMQQLMNRREKARELVMEQVSARFVTVYLLYAVKAYSSVSKISFNKSKKITKFKNHMLDDFNLEQIRRHAEMAFRQIIPKVYKEVMVEDKGVTRGQFWNAYASSGLVGPLLLTTYNMTSKKPLAVTVTASNIHDHIRKMNIKAVVRSMIIDGGEAIYQLMLPSSVALLALLSNPVVLAVIAGGAYVHKELGDLKIPEFVLKDLGAILSPFLKKFNEPIEKMLADQIQWDIQEELDKFLWEKEKA